ncbi:MAG: hypothetical protein AB7G75_30550 [Candidatus Binatia bacterium]
MDAKQEMETVIRTLEEEYRFWTVEVISMDRGIEMMEGEIQSHDSDLGAERAADLRSRLARVRTKHEQIEEKLGHIRERIDELRGRLQTMEQD